MPLGKGREGSNVELDLLAGCGSREELGQSVECREGCLDIPGTWGSMSRSRRPASTAFSIFSRDGTSARASLADVSSGPDASWIFWSAYLHQGGINADTEPRAAISSRRSFSRRCSS
jgi:hypothetical protein